jgi:hypothetical protein
MSIRATGAKSLDMLAVALHALDTIAELVKGRGGSTHALALVEEVVNHVRDGFAGADPNTIHEAFLKLRTDLMENDRDADTALDKKFPR